MESMSSRSLSCSKPQIKQWNKTIFGDIDEKVKILGKVLYILDLICDSGLLKDIERARLIHS